MLRKIIGCLCILASIAVFAFAAKIYGPKFLDYKKSRDLYEDIADKYTTLPDDTGWDEYEEEFDDGWDDLDEDFLEDENGQPEQEATNSEKPKSPESSETAEDGNVLSETEKAEETVPTEETKREDEESETSKAVIETEALTTETERTETDRQSEIEPSEEKGKEAVEPVSEEETESLAETETESEKTEKKKTGTNGKKQKKESGVKIATSENELLMETFKETGLKLSPKQYRSIDVDGAGLLKENKDYVGWIYVPNTGISYPVVQGKNNNEYLHTNFHKEYSFAGTIFMDSLCKKGVLNHHGIIYGHNMRDGSMFAVTKSYVDQKFADEHPVFWFITPKYKLLYRVFSAYEANPKDEDAYAIQGMDFKTNKDWDKILKNLQKKSSVKVKQELNPRDFTLTLSTCTNARTTRIVTTGVLLGALMNEDGTTPKSEREIKRAVKPSERNGLRQFV